MISHAKLLELIGEIDEISLQTENDGATSVYIDIGGERIHVIKDYATNIDHSVTRYGIASCIHSGGI